MKIEFLLQTEDVICIQTLNWKVDNIDIKTFINEVIKEPCRNQVQLRGQDHTSFKWLEPLAHARNYGHNLVPCMSKY